MRVQPRRTGAIAGLDRDTLASMGTGQIGRHLFDEMLHPFPAQR